MAGESLKKSKKPGFTLPGKALAISYTGSGLIHIFCPVFLLWEVASSVLAKQQMSYPASNQAGELAQHGLSICLFMQGKKADVGAFC